jgi:hypothetical protein
MGRFWCRVLVIGTGVFALSASQAKECRSDEGLAPGVRMPERTGCVERRGEPLRPKKPLPRVGREPGFIDMGNGLQVRIGGQVDFGAGHRRR